eukprot:7183458-Ditylum_brightwellii.AAC.1
MLQEIYMATVNMKGEVFCGITLQWNYDNWAVDLSMPGYIAAVLHKFQCSSPEKPEHTSHPFMHLVYHQGPQLTPEPDCLPELSSNGVKCIQQIIGTLLYYAHVIDPTMHIAINATVIQQLHAPQNLLQQ